MIYLNLFVLGEVSVHVVYEGQAALLYHTLPHALEMVSLNLALTIFVLSWAPASKPH